MREKIKDKYCLKKDHYHKKNYSYICLIIIDHGSSFIYADSSS